MIPTPEEKAKELVDKFRNEFKWVEKDFPVDLYRDAKQCALICVDEIIESWAKYNGEIDKSFYPEEIKYWQQVKESINKL